MGLREAYKMVIKHQLDLLEEEGEWSFDNKDLLVEELHDQEALLEEMQDTLKEHLEIFGENYELFR